MTSVDLNDIIDDQIDIPKQQPQSRISPSSSQASLSKKIINNYKSQSLQSMNVLLNSGSISKESKNRSSNFKSSDHINHRGKKNDNFSINLVTSEEEGDDDQDINEEVEISEQVEVINNSESRVVVTKLNYENHHIEQINEALHKNDDSKKEKRRSSGTSKNYDDSDDDCTPSNSYHNSSESNSSSASYNSLSHVNIETPKQQSILKVPSKSKTPSLEDLKDESLIAERPVSNSYTIKKRNTNDDDDYITPRSNKSDINTKDSNLNSENDNNIKDQLSLLKYELKEKDLDIVQLQKEINELQLDNKMLKARIPLASLAEESGINYEADNDQEHNELNNRYFEECRVLRREKECALEELFKAQDMISRMKIEKNNKSIDMYDPNNPEILQKRLKHYEKQLQELEDENEKHVNELSRLEKSLSTTKTENNDLKSLASEARIYKEREDSLILEIANLKNEISKCVYSNEQLNEDNQRLAELIKNRPPSPEPFKGVSVAIQTLPVQQPEYQSNYGSSEDPNEAINRKLQQQQQQHLLHQQQQQHLQQQHIQQQQHLHSSGRTISQTINPYEYYYQQNKSQPTNSNVYPSHSGSSKNHPGSNSNTNSYDGKQHMQNQQQQYEHEVPNEPNPYMNGYPSQEKYRLSEKTLSTASEHHNSPLTFSRDSRRGSTHSSTYSSSYQQNDRQSENYRDGYSISRNDDYLINNFRPFAGSVNSNNNSYRQNQSYHGQQQPTISTTSNSSRNYPQQSAAYQNALSQRSTHSMHTSNSQGPNGYPMNSQNPGSSYNLTSLQRQREMDTTNSPFITKLKLDDQRPTLSTSSSNNTNVRGSMPTSRFSNFLNNSYSRSNSIVNINNSSNYKSSNSLKFDQNNDYNNNNSMNSRHDEPQDTYSHNPSRRDSNDEDDYDFGRSYYRSKSVDRTSFERKNLKSFTEKDDLNIKSSMTAQDLARKRPFVPLKADDIRLGNYIKFSRPGGKISKGSVKYIGPLPERGDVYFGLELDSEEGKHDGIYQDKRYFQTKPNKGVFVSFSKVVMAWG